MPKGRQIVNTGGTRFHTVTSCGKTIDSVRESSLNIKIRLHKKHCSICNSEDPLIINVTNFHSTL